MDEAGPLASIHHERPANRPVLLGFQATLFFPGLSLRRSGYPACGGGLVRRTVQHDEVGSLPSKRRLLASVSLPLVSVLNRLGERSSVSLSLVPRDDNGKPGSLSGESVETSQRSAANDDTNRLSRRQLDKALFLCGFRVFARHNTLIGSDRLLLCPAWSFPFARLSLGCTGPLSR